MNVVLDKIAIVCDKSSDINICIALCYRVCYEAVHLADRNTM